MDVKNIVDGLCQKYKTNDPYQLADALGIQIHFYNLGRIRGYYYMAHKVKLIYLHNDLPDHLTRFVLCHEIGHAIMHPRTCTPFLQTTLFSVDKLEVQANKFASELIIQDVNLMEHWDYTIDQWATYYGLPREIIELRLK